MITTSPVTDCARLLRTAFDAALIAGDPGKVTKEACSTLDTAPSCIISVGKAAGAMATAARDAGLKAGGIVVTTDENYREIAGFTCFAAAHPVPDQRGLDAAQAVADRVVSLGVDDHLLLLISGGGSALLPAPADGVTLEQKIQLNDALLASGMDIHKMNIVRRLFSRLKGGRLARLAAPAKITQFLLSDVPDDRPESIASGLAVADPVPLELAVALIRDAGLDRLAFVPPYIDAMMAGKIEQPVRRSDPALERVSTRILASNIHCREAASRFIAEMAPDITQLPAPALDGEAAEMAQRLARQICRQPSGNSGQIFGLVAGGETTVTLGSQAAGLGGRSQELALAFAAAMNSSADAPEFWAILAGGTDGRDGPTDAAGGLILSSDVFEAEAATAALLRHDSYHYLKQRNQLLRVGATGTNLADLVLVLARR